MEKLIKTELIKNYLADNCLTIKRFCEICDIKYYNYQQIMKQDGRVKAGVIYKVVKLLKIKMRDLLGN